jgi:hypothetical protein
MIVLPSKYQINDSLWLTLWSKWYPVDVISVNFKKSKNGLLKVTYDIVCLSSSNSGTVRLYNIEEENLEQFKPIK